jgi:hypothetical protein
MTIPCIVMWSVIIFFYKRSDISKMHILWLMPVAIVAEILISAILVRLFRRHDG